MLSHTLPSVWSHDQSRDFPAALVPDWPGLVTPGLQLHTTTHHHTTQHSWQQKTLTNKSLPLQTEDLPPLTQQFYARVSFQHSVCPLLMYTIIIYTYSSSQSNVCNNSLISINIIYLFLHSDDTVYYGYCLFYQHLKD